MSSTKTGMKTEERIKLGKNTVGEVDDAFIVRKRHRGIDLRGRSHFLGRSHLVWAEAAWFRPKPFY